MSQQDQSAVQAVLGDEFYKYMPGLAHLTKSVKAAVMLSYLLYWQGKGRKRGSIYKSVREMKVQTGLSRSEQENAIKICSGLNILTVKVRGIPATRHFYVDTEAIIKLQASMQSTHQLVLSKVENSLAKIDQTNTENNKEIAKEILDVYYGFLRYFGLNEKDCKLTVARQKLIADRLADAGIGLIKRAIVAASHNEFYLGTDDRVRRGTIENIFKTYEKIENLANLDYDPYTHRR